MHNTPKKSPLAYFITFTTYGTWLHGNKKYSVDPKHNIVNQPRIPPNQHLLKLKQQNLTNQPVTLNKKQRDIVLLGIIHFANKNNHRLHAAHIRSNHAHLLIQSSINPSRLIAQSKAAATKFLKKHKIHPPTSPIWTRHGSSKYIWHERSIYGVMKYIIEDQGDKMACYYEKWLDEK